MKGGVAGAVLNGANEGAVALFLAGKITFNRLSEYVIKVVDEFEEIKEPTLEDIYACGKEAERRVLAMA